MKLYSIRLLPILKVGSGVITWDRATVMPPQPRWIVPPSIVNKSKPIGHSLLNVLPISLPEQGQTILLPVSNIVRYMWQPDPTNKWANKNPGKAVLAHC